MVELSPSICEISTIQTREGSGKHLKGLKFFQANIGPFLKQTLGEKKLVRADVREADVTFPNVRFCLAHLQQCAVGGK